MELPSVISAFQSVFLFLVDMNTSRHLCVQYR